MRTIRWLGFLILLGVVIVLWPGGSVEAQTCGLYATNAGYVCGYQHAPTFVEASTFDDSFLNRRLYGRLADLTDVYAGPSRGAALVRNVGDGFLFATVHAVVQEADGTWYQINAGEWVHESDFTPVTISSFRGVETLRQPDRPFGWIVADVRLSSSPGGPPRVFLPRLERYTFFQVYDAVEADDGWIWYDIGNGQWLRQTYVSLVDPKQRPAGVGPEDFWVEVDLYEQTLAAYEGDRLVYASVISSGLNRWPTREGLFQVWERWDEVKMSGAENRFDYYFVEDVPHTMYFDDQLGIALHGAYWHDRFGYKHSHGCVNIPPRGAEWIYRWSENAPDDLWVWVHTSDPEHYFTRYTGYEGKAPIVEDRSLSGFMIAN